MTELARTPTSRAMPKSSAAARICVPMLLRRKKTTSPTSSTMVIAIVTTWSFGMRKPSTTKYSLSS